MPAKRKTARKTSVTRSRVLRTRKGLMNPQKGFSYVQTVTGDNMAIATRFLTQTNAAQFITMTFKLSDCAQSSTFIALYDQYKIDKVVVRFIPMTNCNLLSTAVMTGNPGVLGTSIDFDDSTLITTLNQMTEYSSFRQIPAVSMKTHVVSLRPRISNSLTWDGKWIPCDNINDDRAHQSIRVYIDPYASINLVQNWQVFCQYYLSFRNVK